MSPVATVTSARAENLDMTANSLGEIGMGVSRQSR
jgi:hypothetical protein